MTLPFYRSTGPISFDDAMTVARECLSQICRHLVEQYAGELAEREDPEIEGKLACYEAQLELSMQSQLEQLRTELADFARGIDHGGQSMTVH